ncbi:MAG: ATP-binding protein, partial [Nitrospinales bacterium]
LNRDMWVQKKSGGIFPAKLAVSQATWGDKRVFIGTFLDLSEQKKAHGIIIQAKEGLEKKVKKRTQELVNEKASMEVLRVVAEGANELGNVDEATLLCIKKVCEFLNWEAGHAYEVSQMQKERLIPTKLFYFEGEDENLEVFKTQIHSQALIEGVCIPGNIMRDQKIKLFDELDRMCTNCLRDKLISRLGFKMGLGFPILVGNEVAGVLEFFTKTGPKPSAKTLKTLEHIGVILGRAVERDRVDRMKTEFLSTAAHELRTPMTTIKGYSELMMKRELPKVKADRFISLINKESVHLTHIVNDLLDVARIESGDGFVVSMERGDISLVVKEEINLFRESYPNHRFDLTVSGQPMNISFDEGKIRQVIKNLLSNAAKYSPQGGTVLTRLEYSSEGVSCSFLDEGMGMNAEQVKRIFERFYRVDESGAIKGTGLGMAIVKHIIEAHRGKIWVESAIGKGTIIHFNISNFPSGSIQESIKKSV